MTCPRAGIVIYRGDKAENFEFLLLKSSKSSRWSPPKGHLEPGETEFAAAVRETKEETGLLFEDYDVVEVFETILNSKGVLGQHKSVSDKCKVQSALLETYFKTPSLNFRLNFGWLE